MKQKYVSIALVTVLLVAMVFSLARGSTPLADEQFTIDQTDISTSYEDFRFDLSKGDRVSINISVTGDPISLFGVYNSTENYDSILLEKRDITSLNEEWVAPYNDRFDFYFKVYSGVADVNFKLVKMAAGDQGGGLDPLPIAIVAVILVVVFISAFFILRLRKQPGVPPPPPPPPPI
jgi:hypothetical protein